MAQRDSRRELSPVSDLQGIAPPPVENGIGNQFDTHDIQIVNKGKGQSEKLRRPSSIMKNLKVKKKVLGYVQVQVANLSLEETELKKYIEVGIASPIQIDGERCRGTYVESSIGGLWY